jgi:nicotinic acid mononucleotide adenylyltransferase
MAGNPISSASVRNEIGAGFSVRQLVPTAVVEYIVDNKLYNCSPLK